MSKSCRFDRILFTGLTLSEGSTKPLQDSDSILIPFEVEHNAYNLLIYKEFMRAKKIIVGYIDNDTYDILAIDSCGCLPVTISRDYISITSKLTERCSNCMCLGSSIICQFCGAYNDNILKAIMSSFNSKNKIGLVKLLLEDSSNIDIKAIYETSK